MSEGLSRDEKVEKSLDYIQSIITRMANNSFKLKTWTVTLTSGITIFLSLKAFPPILILTLLIPVLFFGALDAYYLTLERRYRELYGQAVNKDGLYKPYDLNAAKPEIKAKRKFLSSLRSPSVWAFYVPIILVVLIYWFILTIKGV